MRVGLLGLSLAFRAEHDIRAARAIVVEANSIWDLKLRAILLGMAAIVDGRHRERAYAVLQEALNRAYAPFEWREAILNTMLRELKLVFDDANMAQGWVSQSIELCENCSSLCELAVLLREVKTAAKNPFVVK